MPIDLTPLVHAVNHLDEGLSRYQSDVTDAQIRDGLILRLTFTYELSHKMLRRYLEAAAADPTEFDAADFQYLIRSANEQGLLLSAWPEWRHFRDMRSKTSHTYDETVALKVVEGIPDFLDEARHLLAELQRRQRV